ncbi:MAG: secretin N-terminal domain-containing protein [Nitrospinaceae bacterium]|nr:secretin N-terminal domain-containing protein [Nitrospinaceae bacterium]
MSFQKTLIFRILGILAASFALASCSSLEQSKKESPTEMVKKQAGESATREITIPLEKPKPVKKKLPDSITATQPAFELKGQATKGFRFTMSARGVDVRNVLFALSQEIEQNIIVDPNVNAFATVDLKNVTLRQALESLLIPLHLEYEMDKDFIRIRKEKMQTRTFSLNYVISRRRSSSNLSSSSGSGGSSGTSSNSSNASATTASASANLGSSSSGSTSSIRSSEETDIWTEIVSGLNNIVTPSASTAASGSSSDSSGSSDPAAVASTGGDSSGLISSLLGDGTSSVTGDTSSSSTADTSAAVPLARDEERAYISVNRQAGLIIVKDFPDVLLQVAEFIEAVEGSVQRQVFIQAKIIEVVLNDDFRLGINWNLVSPFTIARTAGSVVANTTITGAAGFVYGPSATAFSAVLDALSEQGQVSVLSSPKIATLNNQRAVIKVGTEDVFFIPEITPATTTSAAVTQFIPSTITIGIVLDVVPQINPNGEIMMSINTSITERAGERISPDGINVVPILDVRESNNVVLAQHGQTIVIGGLMKTKKEVDDNSVPLFGSLPLVGRFFHWEQENIEKTELVIMLTPEIMAGRAIDDKFKQEGDRLRNVGYDVYSDSIVNPSFRR